MSVFDINKCVFCTSNVDDRTCNFVHNCRRLELSYVEICTFLLPYHLLNVLLNSIYDSVHKETGKERQIVIAQLTNELIKISIRIVTNYAFYSAIFSGIENGSCCSHASSPQIDVGDSELLANVVDNGVHIFPLIIA